MANTLNPAIVNHFRYWPDDAVSTLIRYRRIYHEYFEDRSITDHTTIWERIAQKIINIDNFTVSVAQCKNKWRSLKRGYENLRRMFDGNPNRYSIHSPNTYDTRFYDELSDEFWEQTSNYLAVTLNLSCLNIYLHCFFFRSLPRSI